MEKKHELIDNAAEKRYEFDLGGDLAMIEYIKAQGFIVLTPDRRYTPPATARRKVEFFYQP